MATAVALGAEQVEEFRRVGFTRIPNAIPAPLARRLSAAFDEIYATPEIDWGHPVTNGRTDGPMVYLPSPQAPLESDASRALLDLYQLPELEALACRFLQTDAVDLMSCHMMCKRPEGPGDIVSTVGSGQIPGRLGWHGARPTPPAPWGAPSFIRPAAC